MTALLNAMVAQSQAMRVLKMEFLEKGVVIQGDFEGSVTGYWVRLDPTGSGIVSYNKKEYTTKPIGFTSLPAGSEVELSHANGIYYSKF